VGASGIAVDTTDIVDRAYGIDETTTNNIGVNLTADHGLEFGTGATLGALQVEHGNGIKVSSAGVAVEPTDIIDTGYGLLDNSDDIRINLTANDGLEFGAGATLGSLGVKTGAGLDTGASGVVVDPTDLVDTNTSYGLYEVGEKLRVNLSADMGIAYDIGARRGALRAVIGDGIDVGAGGIAVDATDIVDHAYGIDETTTNNVGINLSSTSGLAFDTGAKLGALALKTGVLKRALKDGTAAAANVTVSGMAVGDELVSVISYTNKTAIASMADRSAEYAIGAGQLTKGAGTNETSNQLDVMYLDRT
jgi:hypothetical protein